jgi:hypothetical protein
MIPSERMVAPQGAVGNEAAAASSEGRRPRGDSISVCPWGGARQGSELRKGMTPEKRHSAEWKREPSAEPAPRQDLDRRKGLS